MQRVERRGQRRRGVQTLELILITPIVVLVLLAVLEFGMLNVTHATVTHASTVGAREAAKLDPNLEIVLEEVVDEVNLILSTIDVVITDVDGSGTKLVIEDGDDPLNPLVYGDQTMTCDPPITPQLGEHEVRVTLCIEFSATKLNGSPVIDAFSYCGFTFDGKRFHISSVAKKEI